MMGVLGCPARSSAWRTACTVPSIMPEGAIISAPASARLTARRPSQPSVASLSTTSAGSRLSGPQWPWDVYSQKHASAITYRPLFARRSAWIACCTTPSGPKAPLACSSLLSGTPKISTLRSPRSSSSRPCSTNRSTDICAMPGIDATGRRTPRPGTTNTPWMSWSSERVVSATAWRRRESILSRRGRCTGRHSPSLPDCAVAIVPSSLGLASRRHAGSLGMVCGMGSSQRHVAAAAQ